jgi:hypothetical protein
MIDWWDVFINGLWILGLAIVLAAFSYRGAWKVYQPKSGSMLWAEEVWPALGLALFCFGLGLISDQTWKLVVWILLGFVSLGMPLLNKLIDRKKKNTD